MAYHDLRDAIKSKRLVVVEAKSGRSQKYKVVDPAEIDEQLYKTIINENIPVKTGINRATHQKNKFNVIPHTLVFLFIS